MKILLVNTRHYPGGGDSHYTFNLAGLLRSHGHEVFFFAMQGENNLPDPNSDLFVSYIDYRALNQRKNPLTAIQVLTRSVYSSEARRKFAQLVERVKPDIIHLQSIHAHITPSVIIEAKKRSIPVVWTLHDYKTICPNSACLIDKTGELCEACKGGRFWQAAVKRCKKDSVLASGVASLEAYVHYFLNIQSKVDAFLSPSLFLQKRLIANGFPAHKIQHTPLFLPPSMFEQSKEDKGYFLFMSRLEKLKGVNILAEAAKIASNIEIVVVGRGDDNIVAQIPTLFPSNLRYLGFQTGQELSKLIRESRAILVPSQWYENQPFSILEAFAHGKPVIATQLGGMTELVGEDRGLLIPLGDFSALADAIKELAHNKLKAHQLGANAFEYVKAHHSPNSHYEKLEYIYTRLIAST